MGYSVTTDDFVGKQLVLDGIANPIEAKVLRAEERVCRIEANNDLMEHAVAMGNAMHEVELQDKPEDSDTKSSEKAVEKTVENDDKESIEMERRWRAMLEANRAAHDRRAAAEASSRASRRLEKDQLGEAMVRKQTDWVEKPSEALQEAVPEDTVGSEQPSEGEAYFEELVEFHARAQEASRLSVVLGSWRMQAIEAKARRMQEEFREVRKQMQAKS